MPHRADRTVKWRRLRRQLSQKKPPAHGGLPASDDRGHNSHFLYIVNLRWSHLLQLKVPHSVELRNEPRKCDSITHITFDQSLSGSPLVWEVDITLRGTEHCSVLKFQIDTMKCASVIEKAICVTLSLVIITLGSQQERGTCKPKVWRKLNRLFIKTWEHLGKTYEGQCRAWELSAAGSYCFLWPWKYKEREGTEEPGERSLGERTTDGSPPWSVCQEEKRSISCSCVMSCQ